MRASAANAIGRSRREPNCWISAPVRASRGSGERLRCPAPSAWPFVFRGFVRFGIRLSYSGGVNGAAAPSHVARDRPVQAPADRAGDGAALPGPGPRDTVRSRSPSTSLRPARSSGRPDAERRQHAERRAEMATSRNNRRGRTARTGAGETTSRPSPGTPRSPRRSAARRDRSPRHPAVETASSRPHDPSVVLVARNPVSGHQPRSQPTSTTGSARHSRWRHFPHTARILDVAGAASPGGPRWWIILGGIAGVAIGLFTIYSPGTTAIALVLLIGVWSIATGVAEIVAAYTLRRAIDGELVLAVSGVISIAFGAFLVVAPGTGVLAVLWLIGFYAIFAGVMYLAMGIRLRGLASRTSSQGDSA